MKQVVEGFHLSQRKYINNLLKKVKMNNVNALPTPMISGFQLSSQKSHDLIKNAHEYMGVVGGLQHILSLDLRFPSILTNYVNLCKDHWVSIGRPSRGF